MRNDTSPERAIDVLEDLLAIADDLARDDDVDYAPWLKALGRASASVFPGEKASPELHLYLQALFALNGAPSTTRWKWLAVVAALRPLLERAVERAAAEARRPEGLAS